MKQLQSLDGWSVKDEINVPIALSAFRDKRMVTGQRERWGGLMMVRTTTVKYSTCRDCPARQKPCPPIDLRPARTLGGQCSLCTRPHASDTLQQASFSLVVSLATRGHNAKGLPRPLATVWTPNYRYRKSLSATIVVSSPDRLNHFDPNNRVKSCQLQ